MTFKPATLLLLLGTLLLSACATKVPVAVQCPAYPTPPKALAPAEESLASPTPLLDEWNRLKLELIESWSAETKK